MAKNLEDLKEKTLTKLTKLKDKTSKIQHKIHKLKFGTNAEKVVNEIDEKIMANKSALQYSAQYYHAEGTSAKENATELSWFNPQKRKLSRVSKNCEKVVLNIAKMVETIDDFEMQSQKFATPSAPETTEEEQSEVKENSMQSSATQEKTKENAIQREETLEEEFERRLEEIKNFQNLDVDEEESQNNPFVESKENSNANATPVAQNITAEEIFEEKPQTQITAKTEPQKTQTPEPQKVENKETTKVSKAKKESTKKTKKQNATKTSENFVQNEKVESPAVKTKTTKTIENEELTNLQENKKEEQQKTTKTKIASKNNAKSTSSNLTQNETPKKTIADIVLDQEELDEESKISNEAISNLENDEIGTPNLNENIKKVPTKEQSNGDFYQIGIDEDELGSPSLTESEIKPSKTTKKKKQSPKKTKGKIVQQSPSQNPNLPAVIVNDPTKPSILDGIDEKYFKNIFGLINKTIIIGNKNKFNSLEHLEYELKNADLSTMQELGFPILEDPQKANLIKSVMLKFITISKEIRKDQWLSSLNENKKGTFEARKHSNQEAIIDRNLRLIEKLNINPNLAKEYGLSLSVDELENDIKNDRLDARKGLKAVAGENNRDENFMNFYNVLRKVHTLGDLKKENSLNYIYSDLSSENNSFGLTGESLKIALNLVKQEIITRRNLKLNSTSKTNSSEKEDINTDELGK